MKIMGDMSKITISSFAAPTSKDLAVLRSLTPEQRQELLAVELGKGRADLTAGRYTELNSDEDLNNFFDEIRAQDEITVI